MDLYLVRHAIAYDQDARKWPDDALRTLTPAGVKRFTRAARGLRTLVSHVDLILSSPYVRAWQTAELLTAFAHWPAATRCDALTPEHAPGDVIAELARYAGRESVALVGHEPMLHQLAAQLLSGDADALQLEFKKGGVARLKLPQVATPRGVSLVWLLTPKLLRQVA